MASASIPGIQLTCFGVGEGWPCHDRRHSSYLYRFGEHRLLVDCGEGLSTAYKAAGLSYELVDRVLISHLHSDHVGSLSMFMQGLWLEGRHRPITISAPVAAILPIQDWLEATLLFPELVRFETRWEPLVPGRPVRTGRVRIRAFPTTHLESLRRSFAAKHTGAVFDCFGFLFEYGRLRAAHSSDIGHVDDLEPLLAKPLDLLVCELSHVTPSDLFVKLRGRGIGRVVFTHLARELWSDLPKLRREAKKALQGTPFSIARDGDIFEWPLRG
jgi:ribonuclease Z